MTGPEVSWSARVPERLRPAVSRVERTTLGLLLSRTATGLLRIEPFDRAMTLAAQAFTSVLPVILVIAVLRPRRPEQLGGSFGEQIGLPPEAQQTLVDSLPDAAEASSSFGVLGVLVVLVSATSFSRALERMYARVWDVPRPGLRGAWRWLAALLAVVLALGVIRLTRAIASGLPYPDLWRAVAAAIVWSAVWTLVPWLLLKGQVAFRVLAASGVLTGLGLAATALAGVVYLPLALAASARQFGVIGVAFALIGWLFALSMVVVVGSVLGHALARDEGRLGELLRGGHAEPGPVALDPERTG